MVKTGRPRGQAKAERRLKRELAGKVVLSDIIGTVRDIASSWTESAVSNPIVGVVSGIVALDILHRLGALSDAGYLVGLVSIGVLEAAAAAQAIGIAVGAGAAGIGNIIPSLPGSVSTKSVNIASQENLIGTSPNNAISKNAGGGVGRTTVQASGITGQAVSQ